MALPAARVSDLHTCPAATPATPPIPHVGGPLVPPGCPAVLIAGVPAARLGDRAVCVGPPATIVSAAPNVLIGGLPAARLGDATSHGGAIASGCPTVLIRQSRGSSPRADALRAAQRIGAPFVRTGCNRRRAG
ncbi:MAG: PAAR domain-containing protein [Planctomycetes bacterium]|nr:PAAR domain-containing protein [Planctomycetota bacterium]